MKIVVLVACAVAAIASWRPPCAVAQEAQPAADVPAPAAAANPPTPVEAPDTPAGRALARLLELLESKGDIQIASWFAPEFLEQVPADALHVTVGQMRAALGGFTLSSVAQHGPNRLVAIAAARADGAPWRIAISVTEADPPLIDGLQFQPAPQEGVAPLASWADADAALRTLGAARSLAVYEVALDGALTPVHLLNEREPLPIGSAFKLFVLGALAEWVESGAGGADPGAPTWTEALTIREDLKSLPSGVMQNLDAGSTAPLLEFATKMISLSDNTATDHVMARAGRERIEAFYAARVSPEAAAKTLPFLSTREIFNIKLSMDGARLPAYAGADEPSRRAMLGPAGISAEMPSLSNAAQWKAPQGVDAVEWFASTEEMCKVMVELWRMSHRPALIHVADICSANRGLPLDNEEWPHVMFKGGSEPGVLNVTWLLERAPDAKRDVPVKYAVSISVMDTEKPIDENRAIGLAQRALEFLAKR